LFQPPGCRFRLAVDWRKMDENGRFDGQKGQKLAIM
jgi:hypothetical protein